MLSSGGPNRKCLDSVLLLQAGGEKRGWGGNKKYARVTNLPPLPILLNVAQK